MGDRYQEDKDQQMGRDKSIPIERCFNKDSRGIKEGKGIYVVIDILRHRYSVSLTGLSLLPTTYPYSSTSIYPLPSTHLLLPLSICPVSPYTLYTLLPSMSSCMYVWT